MSGAGSVRPQAWAALAVAVLLLVLGLAGRGVREEGRRLERVQGQARELEAMAARVVREQAWLEETLREELGLPGVLVEAYAPGAAVLVESGEDVVLSEGVRLRRTVLVLEGVAWEAVQALVGGFEGQPNPWRLQEAALETGLTGLEGRLVFEGLE